ncbi:MAG: hypothetical protein R2771_06210 [Saprospiraceae bacterium]
MDGMVVVDFELCQCADPPKRDLYQKISADGYAIQGSAGIWEALNP